MGLKRLFGRKEERSKTLQCKKCGKVLKQPMGAVVTSQEEVRDAIEAWPHWCKSCGAAFCRACSNSGSNCPVCKKPID